MKTAAGVCRLQLPLGRGIREPYRSKLWAALGRPSDVLPRLLVAMEAGGMAQRDIESAVEQARGSCVVSQSAGSALTDRLTPASDALRTRALSGDDSAYLCMATVYEPRRRWGSKTGLWWVWGLCVDGRQGLLSLSTAHRASAASGLEGLLALVQRGLQTPVTITTDGAPGLLKAVEAMWPRSLRMRCGFHKLPHLPQKGPPQAWPAGNALVADRREAPTFEAGQRRRPPLLAQ